MPEIGIGRIFAGLIDVAEFKEGKKDKARDLYLKLSQSNNLALKKEVKFTRGMTQVQVRDLFEDKIDLDETALNKPLSPAIYKASSILQLMGIKESDNITLREYNSLLRERNIDIRQDIDRAKLRQGIKKDDERTRQAKVKISAELRKQMTTATGSELEDLKVTLDYNEGRISGIAIEDIPLDSPVARGLRFIGLDDAVRAIGGASLLQRTGVVAVDQPEASKQFGSQEEIDAEMQRKIQSGEIKTRQQAEAEEERLKASAGLIATPSVAGTAVEQNLRGALAQPAGQAGGEETPQQKLSKLGKILADFKRSGKGFNFKSTQTTTPQSGQTFQ